MSIKTLGDSLVCKIPDLTFDIQKEDKIFRCALEVERTQKTASRYKSLRNAYQRAWKVDSIIFGASSESIIKVLRSEFDSNKELLEDKQVTYFDFNKFKDEGLNTTLSFEQRQIPLWNLFNSEAPVDENTCEKSLDSNPRRQR